MATRKKKTQRVESLPPHLATTPPDDGGQTVRTSIVLPQALDENLGLYALSNRTSKSEVIAKLLIEFLTREGYQPLKRPKVEVKY
jgi:hypothetical protein